VVRHTLIPALKSRSLQELREWAEDCPYLRLRAWRTLLFEPGMGWLRWRSAEYEVDGGWYEPIEYYRAFPPLHRLLMPTIAAVTWVLHGFGWHKDDYFGWKRYTWEEWGISLSESWEMRDPEWPEGYL
jgi:hypothetical protein